jgi:ubiquinone/menaquinone biosynthesis C-methylase UbiE
MEGGARTTALVREGEWYASTQPPGEGTPAAMLSHSDGHYHAHRKARAAIVEALRRAGTGEEGVVLDLACGDGSEVRLLEQVSRRIVGVDLALVALARFRKHFDYPVFQGNVRALPFRDAVFDACLVSGLLHHIVGYDDMVPYLAEVRRVLRPGGVVIAVEPNALYPVQWLMGPINRVMQRWRPGWRGLVPHERPLSPGYLMRKLRAAGFEDTGFAGTTFLHNRMPARLARLVEGWEDGVRDRAPFKHFAWWVLVTGRRASA